MHDGALAPAQRAGAQRLRALGQGSPSAYARFLVFSARTALIGNARSGSSPFIQQCAEDFEAIDGRNVSEGREAGIRGRRQGRRLSAK